MFLKGGRVHFGPPSQWDQIQFYEVAFKFSIPS